MKLVGMLLLLAALTTVASAAVATPEIDGTSAVSAIGLTAGALLILGARRKK